MDENAWDLVEDPKEENGDSYSLDSKFKNSSQLNDEVYEASSSKYEMADTESSTEDGSTKMGKDYLKDVHRRSKSPALDSLRKVSQRILRKVGFVKESPLKPVIPLYRHKEMPEEPLENKCIRPFTFTSYKSATEKPEFIPKILSSNLLKTNRKLDKEKCSYLFRSSDNIADQYVDVTLGVKALERVPIYDPWCPIHGSKRRLRSKRLMDMHSFVTSVETADNEELSPILHSQAYLAKMLRKQRRAYLTGVEKIHADKDKNKIRANLRIISIAFLFLFTGFNGLQNLQTTVNGQMGADSLSVFYFSLAISSLFIPSFMINRLGCKLTLITTIGVHILYMFANFIPRYYSLIPASILAGVAASCLWAAKCTYITESGIKYARLNVEAQNVVIVRFFGYFFMVVHISQVIGNLLSSFILINSIPHLEPEDKVDKTCGHKFVDNNTVLSERAQFNLRRPPQFAYLSVVGVDLCCAILALLIVFLFLNALRKDEIAMGRAPKFSADVFIKTVQNLRRPKLLLLIPLTIFNGIEQAFMVGFYTKAYVACGLGIAQIGYVMTSFGVADAICSLVFGPLIKLFGRMPLFVFGAVINMLMIITLMIWPLNPGDRALFNAIAGVWGMADGVWNTQLNGFWVALLGRESLEVAFANYRFWMSSGLAIGFFLIRFTTIDQYLLIAFFILLVGILCYFIVEIYDLFIEFMKTTFGTNETPTRRKYGTPNERGKISIGGARPNSKQKTSFS